MDYDTYSANDAIGKVYIDLNPLLVKEVGSTLSGWLPIYDTMHGKWTPAPTPNVASLIAVGQCFFPTDRTNPWQLQLVQLSYAACKASPTSLFTASKNVSRRRRLRPWQCHSSGCGKPCSGLTLDRSFGRLCPCFLPQLLRPSTQLF